MGKKVKKKKVRCFRFKEGTKVAEGATADLRTDAGGAEKREGKRGKPEKENGEVEGKEKAGPDKARKEARIRKKEKYSTAAMTLFFLTFVLGAVTVLVTPTFSPSAPERIAPGENSARYLGGVVYSGRDNGSKVVGAEVTLEELGLVTRTNGEGHFFFENIRVGTYTITASKEDVGEQTKVVTLSDRTTTAHVDLQLGAPDEELDLTPPIQRDKRDFNTFFIFASAGTVAALAAGLLTHFSSRFFPTFVLGLVSVISVGFIVGAVSALVAVLVLLYSKTEGPAPAG